MNALDEAGGEIAPNRRITADSFRVLLARLKKTPTAFADEVSLPEPAITTPVEIIQETVFSAPVEPVEVQEQFFIPDIEIEAPKPVEKKPWAWVDAEIPMEVEALAPEIGTPVQTLQIAAPVSAPEALISAPEAEIPLPEEAFPANEVQEESPAPELIAAEEVVSPESETEPSQAALVAARVTPEPQPVNGKLDADHVPASGVEVSGIGDIAKSIYMTPTPADRAAFLAEVAALIAAEAALDEESSETASPGLSEPVAPSKTTVRRVKPENDPFTKLALAEAAAIAANEPPDEDAGELARSLLDMMLSNPNAGQPQERALAADALLKLVPRIPLKSLITIVDRLSIMDAPPHLLVSKLIHDPRIEVAGPLLELCNQISDQVLGKVIATGQVSLLRLIARRRTISAALSDQLIEFDDPSVILTLVRNSGATFSHHAFPRLADHASRNRSALAPLATRPDLPAPIAFELFWFVPAELRRYLLSRFLTDSEMLTKILKITHAMEGGEQGMETRFGDREQIETFVTLLNDGKLPEATDILAEIAAIQPDNAARIISDANGEPLTIAFKAIGTNRARFGEIVEILKASDFGIIAAERGTAELQNIFDSMSFNKARVLLTYWDWAVLKSGPYAPAN